jgi:NADPH:quinone reductase-like Zn-dependent oxidoreductase
MREQSPKEKGEIVFALQFTEYGGPEVISLGDAPEPHAGPGQIRIRVRASSVNPMDWKIRSGMVAQGKPLEGARYLGLDAAGVVDEVGEGVTDVAIGDDVFGLGPNTQAEYAVLNAWAPKPASLDWAVAAAAGVVVETAERVLRLLNVTAGTKLFIDGGAGGVGSTTTQIAKARGAMVVASASEANQDYLREIGAIPVIYGEGMVERVKALQIGKFDAVLDAVGKTPIDDLISLTTEPSQVLTVANYGAAASGARVSGGGPDSQPMKALSEAAELLEQSKLVIKIQTFPFDRAAEAHQISQDGHTRGKLVLLPD